MKLLKVDKVAFFLVIFSTCDGVAFAHLSIHGKMFQWCHHKEETSIITLARYSSHPWLFLPLISFSLCLLLCLSCSTHILYPPIPLVASKTLTDKLQGRQRKRNGKRENEVERGSDIRKEKSAWHHSTYFSLFAMFPIFAFITPLPSHFLAASTLPVLLFSPWRSRQIKIQPADVWLTLGHTICSHKVFDHNSI